MTFTVEQQIRGWMYRNLETFVYAKTGEVDCTAMVEAWDRECASGGDTLDPDHVAWEIAAELAEPNAMTEEQAKAALRADILGSWQPDPEDHLHAQGMLDIKDFDREPTAWRR